MTAYRLHYFPESGNSYKLTLCGQGFEAVWTDFGGGVTRSAALPGWKPPYELLPGQRLRRYA